MNQYTTIKKRNPDARLACYNIIKFATKYKQYNPTWALYKAGYLYRTAKYNAKQIMKSQKFIEAAKPFIAKLEFHKNLALERMQETIDEASYSDAVNAVDKFTKLTELLKGNNINTVNINLGTIINAYESINEPIRTLEIDTITEDQGDLQNS